MGANFEAYRAMKAESEVVGWPTQYKTDLTENDLGILRKGDAPANFVWHLYELGTDLLRGGSFFSLEWAKAMGDCNPTGRWYEWKRSGVLVEIGHARALRWIADSLQGVEVALKSRWDGNALGTIIRLSVGGERALIRRAGAKAKWYKVDSLVETEPAAQCLI